MTLRSSSRQSSNIILVETRSSLNLKPELFVMQVAFLVDHFSMQMIDNGWQFRKEKKENSSISKQQL